MAFEKVEYSFPDEQEDIKKPEIESSSAIEIDLNKGKDKKEEAKAEPEPEVKPEPEAEKELEIEVVDDTPKADRNRKTSEPPEDVTEEELEDYSEKEKRFHTLVSLMISSQTKDTVNFTIMEKLRKEGLSPQFIASVSQEKLEKLLYPVSFYKNKAKYIKKTTEILINQYDSDIPNTVKDLVKLPGVGPKMAYLAMNCAWD